MSGKDRLILFTFVLLILVLLPLTVKAAANHDLGQLETRVMNNAESADKTNRLYPAKSNASRDVQ